MRAHCRLEGGPLDWGVGMLEGEIWDMVVQLVVTELSRNWTPEGGLRQDFESDKAMN